MVRFGSYRPVTTRKEYRQSSLYSLNANIFETEDKKSEDYEKEWEEGEVKQKEECGFVFH